MRGSWLLAGICFSAVVVQAQFLAPAAVLDALRSGEIEVTASAGWIDTGLNVVAGEKIRIHAGGEIEYAASGGATLSSPEGLQRDFRDLMRTYPVNQAGRGALIGRFGESAAAQPFLIGSEWEAEAPLSARLFLGVNQTRPEAAKGAFMATITRVAGPDLSAYEETHLPDFPRELIDRIPPRVQDAGGTLGDRVNFVIVGTREQVTEAFAAAGWLQVDKDVRGAILSGVLGGLSKESYVTMPMSELLLFDRTQDFGYAQGDPVQVVAERHHFRLWQAPFDLEGLTVWAGAGTHDVGFDKDQRTGGVTHRIDSEVDKEREYIVESLEATGRVARVDYMTAANAVTEAKTAHGQEYYSDGRTAIIYLAP